MDSVLVVVLVEVVRYFTHVQCKKNQKIKLSEAGAI